MSNEELATAIQQGRSDLVIQLWEQVKAYVHRRAHSTMATLSPGYGVTLEDLMQSGYLALVDALEKYDAEKGAFLTWFDFFLKSEFAAVGGYRTTRRDPLNEAKSLDAPMTASSSESEDTFVDFLPSEQDDYADADDRIFREQLHDALDQAMEKLPPIQASVLRGRYWDGKGLRVLAEERGVSAENIRQREVAGLRFLRRSSVTRELEAFLDENTSFFVGTGVQSYWRSGTSSVEQAVLRREALAARWHGN